MSANIMRPDQVTVVLCCAGMGTRLGIGTTKALVDVCEKPLIIRQLELLDACDDVRIVVGFQAERLIQITKKYRSDIMYVFNHQYETTGVAQSLRKAAVCPREYVLSFDGDVLPNPNDFAALLAYEEACVAISKDVSSEAITAVTNGDVVTHFTRDKGVWQWPGIAKIHSKSIDGDSFNVYDMLNDQVPMHALCVCAREINTPEDYENAIRWFENGMTD